MRVFELAIAALALSAAVAHAQDSASEPATLDSVDTQQAAPPVLPPEQVAPAASATTEQTQPATPIAPPPAPYSLPFQLRPAAVGTVVRSDTAFAFYEGPTGNGGSTVASMLLGSYKLTPEFAPLVRLGVTSNSPPSGAMPSASGFSFINPVLGGTYLFKLSPELKLAAFPGVTLPIGMGGGASPDAAVAAANGAGVLARSAMDNAMFAVDYFTIFPGVDLAYVAHNLTLQLELTLLQLERVRGKGTGPGADAARTNFTAGFHAGYFLIPELSVGGELRYQRWLSTPASIKSTAMVVRDTAMLRDNWTFALGVRAHFKLSDTVWLRPGLSYGRGIDNPMAKAKYNIVQLDVPVAF